MYRSCLACNLTRARLAYILRYNTQVREARSMNAAVMDWLIYRRCRPKITWKHRLLSLFGPALMGLMWCELATFCHRASFSSAVVRFTGTKVTLKVVAGAISV